MEQSQLIDLVTEKVNLKIQTVMSQLVPVGVSNRHVHVTEEVLHILFGPDVVLTTKGDVKQPGQFAANECVTVVGPKGKFEKVRILGPCRKFNQVEVSKTDCFKLGVKADVRLSGDIAGTPGVTLIGPKGQVELQEGCIVALRHIHMLPEQARVLDVHDGEVVDVETFGERAGVLGNVVIRVSEASAWEMHIDTDEANALGLRNDDLVLIRKRR